ncbi:MAG: aminopeptidase P family N-terminal domain-containing protein, partial [Pseudomonadota bacterium]
MFQSFDVKSDGSQGPQRVAQLRALMADRGLDAFIVPHSDAHQNEYLPDRDERLAWLTGFTGSAGAAIITTDEALLFVDGRYTLQAADQVDTSTFKIADLVGTGTIGWLRENTKRGSKIGFDPWLHNVRGASTLRQLETELGVELVAVERNMIDEIWTDQPSLPMGEIVVQPKERAGKTAKSKLRDLQRTLRTEKVQAVILTDPTSISWLFNIRGN